MTWLEIVNKLIDEECGGKFAEFSRRTGFSTATRKGRLENPNTVPARSTRLRLEKAFEIKFTLSKAGIPTGYTKIAAHPTLLNGDSTDYMTGTTLSAQQMYELIPVEKPSWGDLSDAVRAFWQARVEAINSKIRDEVARMRVEMMRQILDKQ